MNLDNKLITRFIAGWYDHLEKRISYMVKLDRAINSNPVTVTVSISVAEEWNARTKRNDI
jgi:hypothetical protein